MPGICGETVELRPELEAPDAGSLCDEVYALESLDDSVNRRAWETGARREDGQSKVFVGAPDLTQNIDRAEHGLHPLRPGGSALADGVHPN